MMNLERFKHYFLENTVIDKEHLELFDISNKLIKSLYEKNYVLSEILLEELLDYTVAHNETELSIMKEYNYPYTDAHLTDNDKIIQNAKELMSKIKNKDILTLKVSDFESILITHIDYYDRQLTEYIKSML